MKFKHERVWPVSGFKEPQDLSVEFYAEPFQVGLEGGGFEHTFTIDMEGDIVVDDGQLHYAMHSVELDVEKARQLYDELGQWLNERDGST